MQQRTGTVHTDRADIVEQPDHKKLCVIFVSVIVVGHGITATRDNDTLHRFRDRLFDPLSHRIGVIQLRFFARDAKASRIAGLQKTAPRHAARRAFQFVKRGHLELGDPHNYTARRTQPEIRRKYFFVRRGEGHTSRLYFAWRNTKCRQVPRRDFF